MQQSIQPLQAFASLNRDKIELKDPVIVCTEAENFIIRNLLKRKDDNVMCELEMDDDKMMRPYSMLPADVQEKINEKLRKQIA